METRRLSQYKELLTNFNDRRTKVCRRVCGKSLWLLKERCSLKGDLHKFGVVDDAICSLKFCLAKEGTPLPANCNAVSVRKFGSLGRPQITFEETP